MKQANIRFVNFSSNLMIFTFSSIFECYLQDKPKSIETSPQTYLREECIWSYTCSVLHTLSSEQAAIYVSSSLNKTVATKIAFSTPLMPACRLLL